MLVDGVTHPNRFTLDGPRSQSPADGATQQMEQFDAVAFFACKTSSGHDMKRNLEQTMEGRIAEEGMEENDRRHSMRGVNMQSQVCNTLGILDGVLVEKLTNNTSDQTVCFRINNTTHEANQ